MAHPCLLIAVLLCTAGTLSMKTLDRVPVIEGETITIPCLYDNKYKLNKKYWCNGNQWFSCSIVARANYTGKWTITDYPDHHIFTVILNNSASSDSGYYWCAVEIDNLVDDSKYLYLTVQKAPDVSVINSSVSGHESDNVSVRCFYSSGYKFKPKRWCRIEDRSCFTKEKTYTSQNPSVQISDDGESSFTVLMTGLRLSDSGWYYCSVGDLQVPVQLTVHQRENKTINTSKSDKSSDNADPFSSNSLGENSSNGTENQKNVKEPKIWVFLLSIAVPLLLLLMLVLVIWRIIQKHNLSSQKPDACSVAPTEGTLTYDMVVFKKAKNDEQNSISHPPDQDEVIYSAVKHH
ncbi:polymeric immunoglobulin receptor-like [Danio aesculapii]|uniref:polymeric immunoglobulin receptor-like n=1 Tax=Danio aesculapii TaxID=1142201 RepID=UPI0024BF6D6F|nr:polymeric immunoglobulin receptor-like [Danio aesculapii]